MAKLQFNGKNIKINRFITSKEVKPTSMKYHVLGMAEYILPALEEIHGTESIIPDYLELKDILTIEYEEYGIHILRFQVLKRKRTKKVYSQLQKELEYHFNPDGPIKSKFINDFDQEVLMIIHYSF